MIHNPLLDWLLLPLAPSADLMRVGPRFVYTVGGTESVSIRYLMMSGIMHTTTKNTMSIVPITQR